jgi:hypothetical protein
VRHLPFDEKAVAVLIQIACVNPAPLTCLSYSREEERFFLFGGGRWKPDLCFERISGTFPSPVVKGTPATDVMLSAAIGDGALASAAMPAHTPMLDEGSTTVKQIGLYIARIGHSRV